MLQIEQTPEHYIAIYADRIEAIKKMGNTGWVIGWDYHLYISAEGRPVGLERAQIHIQPRGLPVWKNGAGEQSRVRKVVDVKQSAITALENSIDLVKSLIKQREQAA